ncbi:MAG: alpha/beta hydrolase [Planctomycetaceae bacterium]|nr:alpha/beta hydrolase [Planctomycetaceae bacterium]
MKRITVLLLMWCAAFSFGDEPKRDVAYDTKHKRDVLDFWPAVASGKPAPVFVWFHGGGFQTGDKSEFEKNRFAMLQAYQDAGFAVASCNYPLLSQDIDHLEIARHCARAIQFLRGQSKDWQIDPGRIVCGGASAGAIISEYLAYQDDYAMIESDDEVARLSSRPNIVVSLWQPWRTKEIIIPLMESGEAPVFLYSNAPPKDKVHPPWAADLVYKTAQKLAIPTLMYGGDQNELPQVVSGTSWLEQSVQFCQEHLEHIKSVDAQ